MPAERFKSKSTHLVPLSKDVLTLLKSLPTFTRGNHLFSTSLGQKPVTGFAKAKLRLDKLMAQELGKGVGTIPTARHPPHGTYQAR